MKNPHGPLRVGVGGPVGSGKTSLMDALCKNLRERYDIVVDFTNFAGERIDLANKSPFPAPVVNPASPLAQIMQFRVTAPLNTATLPNVGGTPTPFDAGATLTTDTPAAALTDPLATTTRVVAVSRARMACRRPSWVTGSPRGTARAPDVPPGW